MFIIDVSPSMGDLRLVQLPPGPDGEARSVEMTNLEWSLKYVKLKIQQMIYGGRKTDRCGVVLFGTAETDNPVSDEHGGYDHVTLLLPIHQPTPRTLARIDQIQPSTEIGDFLDGIIVATWVQNEELGKKASWTRKAVMITDGQNPLEIEEDDVEATVTKLNEWNVDLTLVGIDFDDLDLPYQELNKPNIKQKNEEFFHNFVSQLKQGTLGTCEYAIQVAREPDIKVTKSTLMANILTIGDATNRPEDSIAINIQLAKATAVVSPPPMKKFFRRKPPGVKSAGASEPQTSRSGGESQSQSQSQNQSQSQSQSQNTSSTPGIPLTVAAFADVAPLELKTEYVLRSALQEAEERESAAAAAAQNRKRHGGLDDEDSDAEGINPEPISGPRPSEKSEPTGVVPTVDKQELLRAYKYGLSWVPIDDDSSDVDKLITIKGLEIVGFSYESLWTRDWSMGEVYYIFGDKTIPRAQVAFSSLVQAMQGFERKREHKADEDEDMDKDEQPDPVLAIVRFVSRDNSEPKMGVALARSTDKIDYMVWVRMPFAEDLRRFAFPSLDIIKDKSGKPKTSHSSIPTPVMQSAMDNLVLSCDLEDAGPKDEEGNRTMWYDPSEAVHPAVHRLKEAMFHAAVTTDLISEPVPIPHPDITKFFDRPKRVVTRSKKVVETCKEAFNVTKVPPRVPFRKRKVEEQAMAVDADVPVSLADLLGGDAFVSTWADWDPPAPSVAPKPEPSPVRNPVKSKQASPPSEEDSDHTMDSDGDETMDLDDKPAGLAASMVVGEGARNNRIIGNIHPLYDFEQNIARGDVVTKAVADLGEVIPEILDDSFSSQRFDEALDCMKAMRKTAVEEDETEEWNSFMRKFKKTCNSPNFKHPEFWQAVRSIGMPLSLIHDGEVESDVSERGARRFIEQ